MILHRVCQIETQDLYNEIVNFPRSIWKKLHRAEKFTRAPPVTPVTNMRYDIVLFYFELNKCLLNPFLLFCMSMICFGCIRDPRGLPLNSKTSCGALVRFSNWLESQLEERTPPERIIFLQRLLALNMWLVPPHMSHIFGFSGMQGRMLACQNLRKSIQKRARADLVPPPVCQFTESTSFPSYLFQFGKWISLLGNFTFVISTFWWSLNQHQWISSNFILNFLLIFSCERGDTCYDQLCRQVTHQEARGEPQQA